MPPSPSLSMDDLHAIPRSWSPFPPFVLTGTYEEVNVKQRNKLPKASRDLYVTVRPPRRDYLPRPVVRRPLPYLPDELLKLVFQHTFLPTNFYKNEMQLEDRPALWHDMIRQKINAVEVCRTWYSAGIAFLYEDIYIRKESQVARLHQTLVGDNDLRLKVKAFAFIPHASYPIRHPGKLGRHLRGIPAKCPNLDTLRCSSFPDLLPRGSISHLPSTVVHLQLDVYVPDEMVCEYLNKYASQLETLTFLPPIFFSTLKAKGSFDNLKELNMVVGAGTVENLVAFDHWSFPSLQRLGFDVRRDSWLPDSHSVEAFCKRHCQNLQGLFLNIPKSHSQFGPDLSVQRIIDACPTLKHLIIQPILQAPIQHPTIEWVDVWSLQGADHIHNVPGTPEDQAEYDESSCRPYIRKSRLPALVGMRTVCDQTRGLVNDRLPFIFPPSALVDVRSARYTARQPLFRLWLPEARASCAKLGGNNLKWKDVGCWVWDGGFRLKIAVPSSRSLAYEDVFEGEEEWDEISNLLKRERNRFLESCKWL